MIPFLLVMAVTYWLAAPDPVTAGARTAAGTGALAAGTGARNHWAGGREQRRTRRTKRRDRWWKAGGWRRNALRAEHAAVWLWGAGKTTAGLTAATVRPVPAAVRAGWAKGRERHQAKAGNRPVPVALDPPWWRREQGGDQPWEDAPEEWEQVQEQPREQDGNRAEEQGPDQWRVIVNKGRRGYEGHVLLLNQHPGLPEQYVGKVTGRTPEKVRAAAEDLIAGEQNMSGKGRPHEIEWIDQDADLTFPSPATPSLEHSSQEQPLDTEEQIRARRGDTWNRMFPEPLTESDRRFWTARDSGYAVPLDQDGRPGDPDQWPFKSVLDPADTPTDQPAGSSPDGTITPTEGDPMPYTGIDELDNLTSVKDMAKLVADMAEESDFAQLVEFCKNASDETRDFGSDMAGDVAEFEEIAAKIGDLLAELADAAQKVDSRADELIGG